MLTKRFFSSIMARTS